MDQFLTVVMAGSQTLVAIIAIIFTGVTYWERSKFSEELERLRREQRKLDDREFLDGEHAQKVRQLAESMFNAHMTVWPVVEATLRDNLGKMADGIIAGHEENRKELERLRYELGLFSQDAEDVRWAADSLVGKEIGDKDTLILMQRLLSRTSPELTAILRPHYEKLHREIVGALPHDSSTWTGRAN